MFSELAKNLKVNTNVFDKQVLNYSTTTELVNLLVKKYNVPFRTSHKIVGAVIKKLIEKKLTLSDLNSELLNKTAKETASITLTVKLVDIKNCCENLKSTKEKK